MSDLREVIAELRRLEKEATQGKWRAVDDDPEEGECSSVWIGEDQMIADVPGIGFGGRQPAYANASLIAATRNALPVLLDAAERGLDATIAGEG